MAEFFCTRSRLRTDWRNPRAMQMRDTDVLTIQLRTGYNVLTEPSRLPPVGAFVPFAHTDVLFAICARSAISVLCSFQKHQRHRMSRKAVTRETDVLGADIATASSSRAHPRLLEQYSSVMIRPRSSQSLKIPLGRVKIESPA